LLIDEGDEVGQHSKISHGIDHMITHSGHQKSEAVAVHFDVLMKKQPT